ncbi:MAG: photosystem stability/assembly factor-like protein [Flavipsychrobacter sp.]|nr:photosystem stability/assembly factor-like protein [Flavipsychrobacter sp.]
MSIFTDYFTDMQFATRNIGFVCGGSGFSPVPNILMTTKDGGYTWDSVVVTTHPAYEFTSLDFKATATDVEGVVASYSHIFRVTDTGGIFTNIVKPTFNTSVLDAVYAGNSRVLLLGYDYISQTYRLYSSDDWGLNWDLRYQDSLMINSIALLGPYALAGCDKGTVLKSSDGGNSWIKQKIAADTFAFYKAKFASNGFAYLLASKTMAIGGGYVYGSDNFGQSWHSVQVDPHWWLSDISMPTISTGYIVSNRSVYRTTTGGGLGLSVEDVEAANDGINVYPNPANDIVHVDVPAHAKLLTLSLYDVSGRLVKQIKGAKTLDISTLSKGAYLLEIGTGQGLYKRKLLLQ